MTRIWRITLFLLLALGSALSSSAWAQNAERGTHVVKAGETLYRISKMYNITVETLYQLNPEARDGINPGQVLQLPSYQDQKEDTYHMVQGGQTLYSISNQYGVSISDILKANSQIKSEKEISAGMIIRIPPRSSSSATSGKGGATPIATPKDGMTGLKLYTVPQGATVYSLLNQTGWTEAQLLHYNPQLKDGLKSGMTIMIPDSTVENNLAVTEVNVPNEIIMPAGSYQTMVLALPFANDKSDRFKSYYEGFLMSLLELKKNGASFAVQVLDCSDQSLASTIQEIAALPRIDLILGGVSEQSVKQLAEVARQKSATYVIPFTSQNYSQSETKGMNVYQVNTPHAHQYAQAAKKFVQEYKGYHVQIINFFSEQNSKEPFIKALREELSKNNISYTEAPSDAFASSNMVELLSYSHDKVVVVPNSGSLAAADNTVRPISAAVDSLGITNVTAFGYPEWQTYEKSLGKHFSKVEAAFYTTFHTDTKSSDYKSFERDFRSWYGHGLGNTFPRYGLLGYDTGRFFLTHLYRKGATFSVARGIQSEFRFEADPNNSNIQSNMGVFFVRYNRYDNTLRF